MKIYINAHSSIRLEGQDKTLFFDPFMIRKAERRADVIFFTHSHYDHFSEEDAEKVIKKDSIIVAPSSMKEEVEKLYIKKENVYLLKPNDILNLGEIKVKAIPAYNTNKAFHPKEKGWLGYLVNIDGKDVYITGDTDITEESKEIKCDVLLIPIGGTYTTDYIEASRLTNLIKPKIAIPMHYGSIVGEKELGEKYKKLVSDDIEVKILL